MALNLKTDNFKLVGGASSLDFINTVLHRISNPNQKSERDYLDLYRPDKLHNYADLLAELIDKMEARRLG